VTKANSHTAKKIKTWKEEYLNFSLGGRMAVNDDYLEKLGFEFVEWATQQKHEKKPCTRLQDFYELKGMHHQAFNKWCKKNKVLMQCREQAKMIICNLRENGVNRREFHPGLIEKSMHMYDPEWEAIDSYQANLKAKAHEKNKQGDVRVVITPAIPTDIPPMRRNTDVLNENNEVE